MASMVMAHICTAYLAMADILMVRAVMSYIPMAYVKLDDPPFVIDEGAACPRRRCQRHARHGGTRDGWLGRKWFASEAMARRTAHANAHACMHACTEGDAHV